MKNSQKKYLLQKLHLSEHWGNGYILDAYRINTDIDSINTISVPTATATYFLIKSLVNIEIRIADFKKWQISPVNYYTSLI